MVDVMEVVEDCADEKQKQHEPDLLQQKFELKYKQNLFNRLKEWSSNYEKCYSQAIFIQARYKQDLNVLIELFEFYIENDFLPIAVDLVQNDLIKNFDFIQQTSFDFHLNKFCLLIIKNMCPSEKKSAQSSSLIAALADKDEFYFKLFQKLTQQNQEVLIIKILDKLKSNFSFLKNFIDTDKKQTSITPSQQQADLKDFYLNLSRNFSNLYILRDMLIIFKKHAFEYGLYLIDTFLNIEKHLYANLVQNSVQLKIDPSLISIEKRSLNLLRRVCVLDLINEFAYLLDKLDNRHCYRWIEKSLEFFTKYSITSTKVIASDNDSIKLSYSSIKLLHDSEIILNESYDSNEELKQKLISEIKQSLEEQTEFKYEPKNQYGSDSNPYYNVYKLLDEISKKLDWPTIQSNDLIEDKMTYLFNLKLKQDKSVSMSSLNKQISFYSLAFFFNKLTEFQALNKNLFNECLIISPLFRQLSTDYKLNLIDLNESKNLIISNLIYCLKIWQKFNNHKEYYTIVTKCLSNSKLDSLTSYKNFISDYYNSYQLSFNSTTSYNWENLTSLNLRQKIPVLSFLFINEKKTVKTFFQEMLKLINQAPDLAQKNVLYESLILSSNLIEMFEVEKNNLLNYTSKIMTEKLLLAIEQKKTESLNLLSKNDFYIGVILILVQTNKSKTSLDLYEHVYQLVKAKQAFEFQNFLQLIHDVQILQDFFMIFNNCKNEQKKFFILSETNEENYSKKFVLQTNSAWDKIKIFEEFFKQNLDSIITMYDQILAI